MAVNTLYFGGTAKVSLEIHKDGKVSVTVHLKSGLTFYVKTTIWELLRYTFVECKPVR